MLVERHLARDGDTAVLRRLTGEDAVRLPLPLCTIGVGKAAAGMARACERLLGAGSVHGLVITADGCQLPLASIELLVAGHPLPDRRGLAAARRLLETLGRSRGPVLCLLSGGASSLLVQPRPPVSLTDKIATSELLLDSGAEITEFNTVRKHLSTVKGGGLLRRAAGPFWTLALSDVVGDDPAVIGSGPTVPDPTTYGQAVEVLHRYDLLERVPGAVRHLLEAGREGRLEETVKAGDPEGGRGSAVVVGSNRIALAAAAAAAVAEGCIVRTVAHPLQGDTAAAAELFAREVIPLVAESRASGRRISLLAGGETTVRVTGTGRGGRNQQFALELVDRLHGQPVALLSAGSDGIDGPTDAAGAFVDGRSLEEARALGYDPREALGNNDAYGFFERSGDLFRPGPTGTNVADLKLAVIG